MTKSEYQKPLEVKKEQKKQLYGEHYGNISTDTPLLLIFAPDKKKKDLFANFVKLLEGLAVLPYHVLVLANGQGKEDVAHVPRLMGWVDKRKLSDEQFRMYEMAADMAVLFEEDKDLALRLMSSGVVVLGSEKLPMLENYHPNDETGNSFTFSAATSWDVFPCFGKSLRNISFSL